MRERIVELRKILGLTQQQFGDKLGIKRGTVANYEVGRNLPSKAVMRLICEEFGINRQWLEQGTGPIFIPERQTAEIKKMANYYLAQESDSFRSRLISVISELSEEQLEVLAFIAAKIRQ